MADFEKLGSFYLGKAVQADTQDTTDELVLYDAKDLTTHALCVGMTGSGKTGLGIGILEEAAIDGIPSIVIDPKGDLGNLLLTFPSLKPSEFLPWVDESEAMRKGLTKEAFAKQTADLWKNGLADWGQDAARIQRLRDSAEFAIYTPGSSAGIPLTILRSFSAPPEAIRQDSDAMREQIMSAVSGLLALLGIEADPIQSKEHILLSNIVSQAWNSGQDLDLAELIRSILSPPFEQLGVFDLDTFYPESERRTLAMRLNNVLASPSFSVWREGVPLDINRLFYSPEGKPRVSILSIAHLSDSERMFFVTLLLTELIAWMRQQPGTSSLRALLYMDEIYGYFPPTANPPSKRPMLTLLKQARAYGLGTILATQNPVDLDYKGLGNTGTWFIGRLQTERDKLRVLDGLEGASNTSGRSFDRTTMDTLISGLGKRVFLLNNVHEDHPVLFRTRWVLSYLRGPLTRDQIVRLTDPAKRKLQISGASRGVISGSERSTGNALAGTAASSAAPSSPSASARSSITAPAAVSTSAPASKKPLLPSGIDEFFFPVVGDLPAGTHLVYRPGLFATTNLHFVSAKAKMDRWDSLVLFMPLPDDGSLPNWDEATIFDGKGPRRTRKGKAGAGYAALPKAAARARSFSIWRKSLATHIYQNRAMEFFVCPALKLISAPGETEGEFSSRLSMAARENRDLAVEKLRKKYAPRLSRLQERIRKAELRIGREEDQYKQQQMTTLVSVGSTLLGALFGRKVASIGSVSRAATSINRAGRTMREKQDVERAREDLRAAEQKLSDMEGQFREDAAHIQSKDASDFRVESLVVRPRKSDINIAVFALAWSPWSIDVNGIAEPVFETSR